MKPFSFPVRVYWEDTDAGGVVYYANYLKFMERARTEWLRAAGIEQRPLQEQSGIVFIVVEAHTLFRKPARYGDLLIVTCAVAEQGRASLSFKHEIFRAPTAGSGSQQNGESPPGDRLIEATVRVACVHSETFKPRPLPEILLSEINK
jgi:acyl-CoA thioester hydrolase